MRKALADAMFGALRLLARLALAAVIAILPTFILFLIGVFPVPKRDPIPAAVARERADLDQSAAESVGFVLDRRQPLRVADSELPLKLREGECVALIATAWGDYGVTSLVVIPELRSHPEPYDERAIGAHPEVAGVIAHAQLCADATTTGLVRIVATPVGEGETFTGGELRILRAPRDRVRRLVRGWTLPAAPR